MVLHPGAQALRDAVDRALKPRVVERHQPATAIADQMVVVLAADQDALVPRELTPHADALDQPELDQELQYPVDARPPDSLALLTQGILDLDRA